MIMVLSFLMTLLALYLVLAIHEGGHYLVARLFGVSVTHFAIGVGPVLFRKVTSETVWEIRLLPLLGWVKILGTSQKSGSSDLEMDLEVARLCGFGIPEDRAMAIVSEPRMLRSKGPLVGLSVLGAGVFLNILSAMAVMFLMAAYFGRSIPNEPFTVYTAKEWSSLKAGDQVLAVNGKELTNAREFGSRIEELSGDSVALTVRREAETIVIPAKVRLELGARKVGVTPQFTSLKGVGGGISAVSSFYGFFTELVPKMPGYLIAPFTSTKVRQSPTEAFKLSGDLLAAASDGGSVTLSTVVKVAMMIFCVFSLAAGIVNLIPLPPLDGGRMMLLGIEAVTSRKIPDWVESAMVKFGVGLILAHLIAVLLHDLIVGR